MLVVDDDRLHTFQRNIDDVLDVVEALVSCLLATGLLQVESEVVDVPL